MASQPPTIFIMGPTASGKTALAMVLYQHLPVELISVDSAMIYRGMDIGTAKPTPEERAAAPHHLLDICEPHQAYSVAQFRQDALQLMADITAKGKIPLLVGGTSLYFRALQDGLSTLPRSEPKIRDALAQRLQKEGLTSLHQELLGIDPIAGQRIHSNDPQRILRALEVWQISGKTISQLQQAQQGTAMPYRPIKLMLNPPRNLLHQRINQRFLSMLDAGFADEVAQLMTGGDLTADMPAMRAVGYRQMWSHLQGEYDWQEMIQRAQAASRQLAKRQITWMRSEKAANWLDMDSDLQEQALQVLDQALQV